MSRRKRAAFTLVELLVVVAIIAIIVSMLLPALAKARYQAKLVYDLNNQSQIGRGAIAYTAGNRGFWPTHADWGPYWGLHGPEDIFGSHSSWPTPGYVDMRPVLRPYFPLNKTLHEPFLPMLDYEAPTVDEDSNGIVYMTCEYDLWFGWRHAPVDLYPNLEGMEKMNQRAEWRNREFNVLVGCHNMFYFASNGGVGGWNVGHPDSERHTYGPIVSPPLRPNQTFSLYLTLNQQIGYMDLNYVFDDGHGKTYPHAKDDNPYSTFTATAPRFAKVPAFRGYSVGTAGFRLLPPVR